MLLANLSLDLDNSWAYLRAAGHSDWNTHPGYFHIAIPRIVALLDELNLPLTTFVVGRDLELDQVSSIQQLATLQDSEFGNHSFNHLPWLHTLPHAELTFEIDRTNELIKQKLGMQPIGFRGRASVAHPNCSACWQHEAFFMMPPRSLLRSPHWHGPTSCFAAV